MKSALARAVFPALRAAGFTGSHPHYRRLAPDGRHLDLVSFQTDKWGGGFLIEVAACPTEGIRDWAGRRVSARTVTAQHMHERVRLPKSITRRDWYRYDESDDPDRYATLAGRVLAHLARKGLCSPG